MSVCLFCIFFFFNSNLLEYSIASIDSKRKFLIKIMIMVAILFANSSCLSFDSIQSQIWWLKSHNPSKNVIHSCMHKSAHLHTIRMSITDFAKSLVLKCYKLMLCLALDTFSKIIVSKSFNIWPSIIMIEISFTFFVMFFYSFSLVQSTLEDQFKNDCYFFDALCRQENLQDIFRSRVQLFPPDLMKSTSGIELKK